MKKIIPFATFYFLSLLFAYPQTSVHAQSKPRWRAGVSRVAITPQASMWMEGYASRDRPSDGTLHELWAKALAFEDAGGQRSVLITTDVVGIRKAMSDRIRDRLQSAYGLSRARIMLNSSHTHSGPLLMSDRIEDFQPPDTCAVVHIYPINLAQLRLVREYSAKFEDQIVELVGSALRSLRPVRLYAGNGVVRFQVNRRNNTESTVARQSDLNGPNDYAVPVIRVEDASGKLLAVAFGYACHNTVLSGLQWSGDYAGFAQIELERTYPGATALFFQGAGGDQNPLPRRKVSLAKQYGRELAAAVVAVMDERMRELAPQLAVAYSEVDLYYANPLPTRGELLKIKQGLSDYPEYRRHSAGLLLKKMEKGQALKESYPFPIQAWKLGDQLILGMGGEPVVDYAIGLKRIFGEDTFVVGYNNDVMGYIPSARIIDEGGYEGMRTPIFTNPWHREIESKIVYEMIQLARTIGVIK